MRKKLALIVTIALLLSSFSTYASEIDTKNFISAGDIKNLKTINAIDEQNSLVKVDESIGDFNVETHFEVDKTQKSLKIPKLSDDKEIKNAKNKINSSKSLLSNNESEEYSKSNSTGSGLYLLDDNPRAIVNETLTEEKYMDFYFFTVTKDTFMVARLDSNNSYYKADLYIIDYETGNAILTNISSYANNIIALNGLPQGDYALAIYSMDNVGASYSLKINATNPYGGYNSIIKITQDLQQFVLKYNDNSIYANGVYVCNTSPSAVNSHLDWERDYFFSYGGNYSNRDLSISSVKIKNVVGPVTYSSSYASSQNVMLIYLDIGTLYTYFESQFQSVPHYYYSSFVDVLGKTTPRRLDADDFNYGDHILAFDLNTGRSIDFYSVLNYYYAAGIESLPTITFIQ
ncbi:hypothetical protein EHE19_010425 [Ruminiclostridium herbifermentans]|uniref:Peptidase C-terminal archaeal/bacterial domain-containing protein n=1 Tax=Ruminiclostridium herbifermentans TaxID=2488810 RepID=A0A4U7JK57_9FIRM|nr:hypothetical protein [Ruminiclostridium herbifermentans]QNU65355.1 hypothetical protein EHE19_010425 [Ruminiclostridium herbifermentans]